MNDLDDLLPRGQASQYLLAHGARADPLDEVLDHLEVYVRFQKGYANFLESFRYILLAEFSVSPELLKNGIQFIGERVEHMKCISYIGPRILTLIEYFSFVKA
jgi:hypothetical protein